jgi:hypothetical protein
MRKSADSRFPGRAAISILLAAILSGCAAYDVRMRERQYTEDEQACTGSGYKPGSNDFAKCLQDRNLIRMRATLSEGGSNTCTTLGRTMACND